MDVKNFIEELKKMTVLELNEMVKAIETEFGVTAAVAVAAVGGGGADAPVVEEKTEFNVILKEVGANKISVIKVVREATGLGLIEAKNMVDGAPATLKENVPKEAAEQLLAKLKEAGATGELK